MTWRRVSGCGALRGSTQADAAEVLWTVWWWHDSIGRGVSPFFCDVLRWPSGAPLSAESWNAVAALVLAPLWGQIPGVPEVALYNGLVLASIVFAGFTAYMLSREIWGGDFAAFL